jgi:hypothetical protein
MDTFFRDLLLVGGIGTATIFIGFGLFFLGYVFSRRENGW